MYEKFNRNEKEFSSCLTVLTKKANVQAKKKKKVKQRKEEEPMAMVDFDGSSPLIWKSWKGNLLRGAGHGEGGVFCFCPSAYLWETKL